MNHYDLSTTQIYIPPILKKGHATIDEMIQPIFKEMKNWLLGGAEKEVVLVGISNGARLASAINVELLKSETTKNALKKVHVISIAGAAQGSSLINVARKMHLCWLFSKPIAQEMPTDSARTQQLTQWLQNLPTSGIPHQYTFLASPHDWTVPNYSSTLMSMPQGVSTKYALIEGQDHCSITRTQAKAISQLACS